MGLGPLGGILLRLAATVCVVFGLLSFDSEFTRTWELGDLVEAKEEAGRTLAWAKLTPVERSIARAIIAQIKADNDLKQLGFIAFLTHKMSSM
jgi:hypothetical protein